MSVTERISATQIRIYYATRIPDAKLRGGKQWRCPCPVHPKATRDSFSINAQTGQFTCFSCGIQGDIVDLERLLTGVDAGTAACSVEALVGLASDYKPTPYTPRPYDPDPAKLANGKNGKNGHNGHNGHGKIVDVYPYQDESGQLLSEVVRFDPKRFAQRRPDPKDASKRVWDINGVRRVVFNLPEVIKAQTVCIVEGEKDALALAKIGMVATTAPGGAQKWRGEYDQWFAGKTVYVIPDSDEPGKKHAAMIVSHLLPVANEVRVVELPMKDVSDYLAAYSREHLAELMESAPVVEPERAAEEAARERRSPEGMADTILAEHRLLLYGDALYEYNDVIWEPLHDGMLDKYALKQDPPGKRSMRRVHETVGLIVTKLRTNVMPHWRNMKTEEIAFHNGVLDIETMRLRPHRKEDYLESVIPHDYTPGKHCDMWLSALRDWFGEGREAGEKICALQEFFGYCLMLHALYKRALFLYGAPDTGKSVVEHMLQRMVGESNCTHIPPDVMGDSRKIAPIKGKYINTVSELSADAMIDDAGFKRLVSTGDAILLDRKYKEPESYIPFCKHIVVTNTLPRINDLTQATYNRLLVISFDKVVGEAKRDPQLEAKLKAEMPGILCWAVLGASRLAAHEGRFTEPSTSRHLVAQYQYFQNPINDFLQEFCDLAEDDEFIKLEDIRRRFKEYQGAGTVRTNLIRQMLGNGRDQRYHLDDEMLKLYGWRWK